MIPITRAQKKKKKPTQKLLNFSSRNKHQAFTIEELDLDKYVSIFIPARLLAERSKNAPDERYENAPDGRSENTPDERSENAPGEQRGGTSRAKEFIAFAITYGREVIHFLSDLPFLYLVHIRCYT